MTAASNPAAELTEAERLELYDAAVSDLPCNNTLAVVERILAARLAAGGAAAHERLRATASGPDLIASERRRQIEDEGYTAEHDAEHGDLLLVRAAQCYRDARVDARQRSMPSAWPWDEASWKPRDPISNLIRAGALFLAAADAGNPWATKRASECADLLDECRAVLDAAPAPTVGRADDTAAVVERAEHVVKAEALREAADHFEAEECDCLTSDTQSICGCGVATTLRDRAAALAGAPSAPAEDQGGDRRG